MPSKKFSLTIPASKQRKVPVHVYSGAITEIPTILGKLKNVDHTILLYDAGISTLAGNIRPLLGKESMAIAVPPGEQSKCFAQVERVIQDLLVHGATKQSVVVCVGGGVLGDIGGFTASVYMRGLRFIHVPTSLMAMVDASVGGHTCINVGPLKNVLGTEYHPEATIIDLDLLRTLPDSAFAEGMVEIVKMAAVCDSEFFGWLEEKLDKVLSRDEQAVQTCIRTAVHMRAELYERGTKNPDVRHLLTFGHTVGHAIEALSGLHVCHGHAVSIGMLMEMQMSGFAEADRVVALLQQLAVPVHLPAGIQADALWDIMQNDKKVVAGQVRLAVPKTIGEGYVVTTTEQALKQAVKDCA